jgi:hypothetical protein
MIILTPKLHSNGTKLFGKTVGKFNVMTVEFVVHEKMEPTKQKESFR